MTDLDDVDRALLRELQRDARQSNRDLAAAVHVSPSTSSERVRALRADGVVRGYHAEVALEALGRQVQALTAVTIRPPTREIIESFRNWATALPEIIGVFVVSGGSDFLLHVAVPDTDALYAFVIDRLTERAEVADVNTSIVYEHLRRPVLEPLPPGTRAAAGSSSPPTPPAGGAAPASASARPRPARRRGRS
jgi:DNA-binding Lrp family transcriptional regulator